MLAVPGGGVLTVGDAATGGGVRLVVGTNGYTPFVGDRFLIVNAIVTADFLFADTYSNTVQLSHFGDSKGNLRQGYGFVYSLELTGSQVWLRVDEIVPEPGTYAFFGVCWLWAWWCGGGGEHGKIETHFPARVGIRRLGWVFVPSIEGW